MSKPVPLMRFRMIGRFNSNRLSQNIFSFREKTLPFSRSNDKNENVIVKSNLDNSSAVYQAISEMAHLSTHQMCHDMHSNP